MDSKKLALVLSMIFGIFAGTFWILSLGNNDINIVYPLTFNALQIIFGLLLLKE